MPSQLSQDDKFKLNLLFSRSLNPSQSAADIGVIEEMAEYYRQHPYGEIVFETLLHAHDNLKSENPEKIHVFMARIAIFMGRYNQHSSNTFSEYCVESQRVGNLLGNIEREVKTKGLLSEIARTFDSIRNGGSILAVQECADFIMGDKRLFHALSDVGELEVSVRTASEIKKQELATTKKIDVFNAWRQSGEFEKFTQAYYRCAYDVERQESRLAGAHKRLAHG